MKRLAWVCIVTLMFSVTTMAADIAFYVGTPNFDGWYSQDAVDADVATIISMTSQLFADVQQFNDDQFEDFGAWVEANTNDGEMDIIWLNGCVPSVLYPFPNQQPDGSPIENWLDGGNMVINVGDWFGYVSYEGGARNTENTGTGAANILDLAAGIIVSADNTAMTVTPTGQEYLPSLGDAVVSYRPIVLSAVVAPWEVAAVFAQNAAGTQADPLVIHNTETGAYVAFVNQSAGSGPPGWLDDRGLTCAEFIINWVGGVVGLGNPLLALAVNPEDGVDDVPPDTVLEWFPGRKAATHDVYFGTSFEDVNNASRGNPLGVLVSENQAATTYDPEGVYEFGTTYYWRIDEVNAAPDNTIFKGEVWSFTAEPFAYPIADVTATSSGTSDPGAGPENTINGSGLNELDQHSIDSTDMWLASPGADPFYIQYEFDTVYKLHEMLVWNYNVQFELILGFGLQNVTVEYSVDGTEWTVLGDVDLAQATAKSDYAANSTIAFDGVAAKYVRLNINTGFGMMGQYGLSEVRFLYIPAQAREPEPANNARNINPSTTLAWRAGRDALSHEVYLSTDEQAVIDGSALVDAVAGSSYAASGLEFGGTYYWKIDAVQETESWEGPLWSFSTQEFAVIDDMESYDDEDNRIYDTWIDGWVNETGSTVGYLEEPFAETSIVNSGSQSMPLQYDNTSAPFHSEAEKDLGGMNLTGNSADSLRLYVQGMAPGFNEAADGTILMNAIGADIWGTGDQFRYVYKSLTGDGSMIARVDDLDNSPSTWAKAGVMIRQGTGTGSQHSFMCLTGGDGNGASWQGRPGEGLDSVNNDATTAVAPPYWVRIDRSGNTFTGFVSADGESWDQIGDPREVDMDDPVLIGLALTSHLATQATSAQFSNVSFTGTVAGAWEVAEIGAPQPAGNDPAPVYVALEDSSGSVAVVTCPADPPASAWSQWTEWVIPYSELGGINLGNIRTMYVGVGDRDNPSAGGTGTIFVDDIGYGRPAPEPAYENLLANGGFEDGAMAPWSTYGDVTAEVVTDEAIEGGASLHLTVNSAGANFWDAGLQHTGHVFEAGKQYTLSAFLRCSEGTLDINFKPELAADPWSGFGDQVFTMTDEWTEFSVTTPVMDADVSPAAITFNIAFAAAEFWIDNVRFYEGEYVAP